MYLYPIHRYGDRLFGLYEALEPVRSDINLTSIFIRSDRSSSSDQIALLHSIRSFFFIRSDRSSSSDQIVPEARPPHQLVVLTPVVGDEALPSIPGARPLYSGSPLRGPGPPGPRDRRTLTSVTGRSVQKGAPPPGSPVILLSIHWTINLPVPAQQHSDMRQPDQRVPLDPTCYRRIP